MKSPERLLKQHKAHVGAYRRVAKELNMSTSYVWLVVHGLRRNEKIMGALIRELRRIESL